MTSLSLRDRLLRPLFLRKLLWLVILTCLPAAMILILPRVSTMAPAIDSKVMAIRALFAVVFGLAAVNWRTIVRGGWQFTDTIFAGLALSFCLSALFSGRLMYCLSEFWQQGAFYGIGWLVYRLRPGGRECLALARIGGCLGLIAALYGFLVYIGMDVLREFYPFEFSTNQGGRNFIHSFYGNPEYFGGVAAPTATLLLGLGFASGVKLWLRALWVALSGFIIVVLLLSGSRGALFGFLAGSVLIFFGQIGLLPQQIRKIGWGALAAGIAVMAVGLVVFSTPNPLNPREMRLAQRFTSIFETSSDSTRERILFYTSTAMAIPENPIWGYGPGTYRLEFYNNVKLLVNDDPRAGTTVLLDRLNRRLAEHTHNDYLEFWFEQGTVGIGLFLLLIVHGGVRFVRVRLTARRLESGSVHASSVAVNVTLFAAVVTILINALTSFPLHMPARGTLAWVLIGAFFAVNRQLAETLQPAQSITDNLTSDQKET